MSLLSREQMQALATTKEVVIPQCDNAVVEVRMLTAAERDEFDASLTSDGGKTMDLKNLRGRLLAKAVVAPSLTAEEWGDAPSVVVGVIFGEVQKLNGMSATAVDTAEKNSASAPSAASSSV